MLVEVRERRHRGGRPASLSGATGMWAGTTGCGIVVTVAPQPSASRRRSNPTSLAPIGEAASLLARAGGGDERHRDDQARAVGTNRPTASPGTSHRCPFMLPPSPGIGPDQSSFEPSRSFDPRRRRPRDRAPGSSASRLTSTTPPVVQTHLDPVRRRRRRPPRSPSPFRRPVNASAAARGPVQRRAGQGPVRVPAPVAMATPVPPPTSASCERASGDPLRPAIHAIDLLRLLLRTTHDGRAMRGP